MRIERSARRYARALFLLAREEGRLERVASDLADLGRLAEASPEFRRLLASPLVPGPRRAGLLRALLEGRADALTLRFVLFLSERGRAAQLPAAAALFEDLALDHAGVVKAVVESATPLTPAQEQAIGERLGRRLGKRVRTEAEVRPELLGGFRVRIGDALRDFTLRAQLEQLRKQWINA